MKTIKVGDTISYRSCFGGGPTVVARVEGLTLTAEPRSKYGKDVQEVNIIDVKANKVLFDLDNGHWCYGDQVKA